MVDELRLTEVLHRAGDTIEIPDGAFERVLAAAGEQGLPAEPPPRPVRRLRDHRLLAVAAGLAVLLTGVVVVQRTGYTRNSTALLSDNTSPASGAGSGDGNQLGTGGSVDVDDDAVVVAPRTGGGTSAGNQARPSAAPPAPAAPGAAVGAPARDSVRIIRTGAASLEVDEGDFAKTMAAITRLAGTVDGYVAATTTSESDDRPSGSITLRVPGESFDRVVADIRGLGDVISLTSSAADVSAEYTDLEARLRALTATRSQFVTLLSKATKIGEILEVQTRINDVQTQIEQIQGKLRLFDDQTSLGSLKVEVYESGDALALRIEEDSRFGRAWDESVDGFLSGVANIVAAAGPTLLVVLCLLVLFVAARIGYRLLRRRLV